ncbi:extracellular solute-binding protein, family 3 [Alteromonadaceae bacterium 2753L.S.0a.02]|nr:extracellular solute-binding protein, family 3 [Alteromonadaceae bacterium 2753L.S.0a.02]
MGSFSHLTVSLASLFIGVVSPAYAAQQDTLLAQFWATGLSSVRANYESQLARAALESTAGEYGPFVMEVTYMDVSFERGRRVVAAGDQVNFFTNPLPTKNLESDQGLQIIATPVMHGLLGYRRLIVRKEDLPRFKYLKSFSDLQQLSAGQVKDWADNSVYTENSLPLVESNNFEKLFFMLSRKRFDYIPLSVAETDKMLLEIGDRYGKLAIVPKVILFYPFPVVFQVSKNNPQLVARLEIGLAKLQKNGAMEKLFRDNFKEQLKALESKDTVLFQLKNSNVPSDYSLSDPKLVKTKHRVFSPALTLP